VASNLHRGRLHIRPRVVRNGSQRKFLRLVGTSRMVGVERVLSIPLVLARYFRLVQHEQSTQKIALPLALEVGRDAPFSDQ
jgi:hypothetical protein